MPALRLPTIPPVDLRAHLETIIFQTSMMHYPASQAMALMLASGCRYNETEYFYRWQLSEDESEVTYLARKNDTWRSFPAQDLPPEFIEALKLGMTPIAPVSYSTVQRLFGYHLYPYQLIQANKALELHSFRHLKARELWASGHSIEHIMAYLGINSPSVAEGYTFKPIYLKNLRTATAS